MSVISESMEKTIWGDYKEPKAAEFFLVNSSWALFVILAVQLYFVSSLGPQLMANRKAFDLRPLMIVLNGLQFGAYGCGVVVIGYGINLGKDAWACRSPVREDFRDDVMLRIAYVLLCMRLVELATPIIMVLRKKPSQTPVAYAIYNAIYTIIIYHCIHRFYREVVYMYPYTDAMKIAVRTAYYTLTSPGPSFRAYAWRKIYVTLIALAISLYNVYHMSYMIVNDCDGPKVLMASFAALAFGEVVYNLNKLIRSEKFNQDTTSATYNGKKL